MSAIFSVKNEKIPELVKKTGQSYKLGPFSSTLKQQNTNIKGLVSLPTCSSTSSIRVYLPKQDQANSLHIQQGGCNSSSQLPYDKLGATGPQRYLKPSIEPSSNKIQNFSAGKASQRLIQAKQSSITRHRQLLLPSKKTQQWCQTPQSSELNPKQQNLRLKGYPQPSPQSKQNSTAQVEREQPQKTLKPVSKSGTKPGNRLKKFLFPSKDNTIHQPSFQSPNRITKHTIQAKTNLRRHSSRRRLPTENTTPAIHVATYIAAQTQQNEEGSQFLFPGKEASVFDCPEFQQSQIHSQIPAESGNGTHSNDRRQGGVQQRDKLQAVESSCSLKSLRPIDFFREFVLPMQKKNLKGVRAYASQKNLDSSICLLLNKLTSDNN